MIIGLVSSTVILTLPGKTPAVEAFAKQLAQETNIMAQDSLLTGTPAALGVSENGYALMTFENNIWETRGERPAPDGVNLTFEKETTKIKLTDGITPLAIFEPIGQATVFVLTISDFDRTFRLESRGDGRVVLETGS